MSDSANINRIEPMSIILEGAEEESEGEAGLNQESEEALSESEDDVENEGPSEKTVEVSIICVLFSVQS